MANILIRHFPVFALALLVMMAVMSWFFLLGSHPLNADAGFYLTAGKYISEGLVPYKDFASAYSPGTFYLFAMLEFLPSNNGVWQQGFVFTLHLINGGVLFACLSLVLRDKPLALFFALYFVLLAFVLDGQTIVLEPFQNFFILASLYVALKFSGIPAVLMSGILLGLALMSKQSSMFSAPAIFLLLMRPMITSGVKEALVARIVITSATFALGASVGFVVFCVLTGSGLYETFMTLVTFSGGASNYVEREYGFYNAFMILTRADNGERLLMFFLVSAGLILILDKPGRYYAFLAGFVLNLLPIIFVRGYGHYIQLLALWGTILLAMVAHSMVGNLDAKFRAVFLSFLIAILASPVLSHLFYLFNERQISLNDQVQLARSVEEHVSPDLRTTIVGHPWLLYLADIRPPNWSLSFVTLEQEITDRFQESDAFIIMPRYREMFENALKKSINQRYAQFASIEYNNQQVLIFKEISPQK